MKKHTENRFPLVPTAIIGMLIGLNAGNLHRAFVGPKNLESAANALNDKLQSGAAVFYMGEEKVDIRDQVSLEKALVSAAKRGQDTVKINLKEVYGKSIINCTATGTAAVNILTGKMPEVGDVKRLEVDTKALAEICGIKEDQVKSWTSTTKPQASAGEYSIKTDDAVAMGTVEGKINQVRHT